MAAMTWWMWLGIGIALGAGAVFLGFAWRLTARPTRRRY
jgi:HAMP domain-containing protein